jgi:hypothetical protein
LEEGINIYEPPVIGGFKTLEDARVDRNAYEVVLTEQLKNLVCSADTDVLFIVRGLIRGDPVGLSGFVATGSQAAGLVETILGGKDCPVSVALTAGDKVALKDIPKQAASWAAAWAALPRLPESTYDPAQSSPLVPAQK